MQATSRTPLVRMTAVDIRRSCLRGAREPGPTQYMATAAPAPQLSADGSVPAPTRMTAAIAAGAATSSASGARKTVFSTALTTVQGAVTVTRRRSLGRAPRRLRRSVSAVWAMSAARSRVMTARARIVPATGSRTLSATAPTRPAKPITPSPATGGACARPLPSPFLVPGSWGPAGDCGRWAARAPGRA